MQRDYVLPSLSMLQHHGKHGIDLSLGQPTAAHVAVLTQQCFAVACAACCTNCGVGKGGGEFTCSWGVRFLSCPSECVPWCGLFADQVVCFVRVYGRELVPSSPQDPTLFNPTAKLDLKCPSSCRQFLTIHPAGKPGVRAGTIYSLSLFADREWFVQLVSAVS